jgi:hypothetical protein
MLRKYIKRLQVPDVPSSLINVLQTYSASRRTLQSRLWMRDYSTYNMCWMTPTVSSITSRSRSCGRQNGSSRAKTRRIRLFNVRDFEPIFSTHIKEFNDSMDILFDADQFAGTFLPIGRRLFDEAEEAENRRDTKKAQDLFLWAGAVYRIARSPVTRKDSPRNWQAWEEGKRAYLRGARYFDAPIREISNRFHTFECFCMRRYGSHTSVLASSKAIRPRIRSTLARCAIHLRARLISYR